MIELATYKDKPILVLRDDDKNYRKISFGLFKAKLIIKNIEAIKKFLQDNEE